MSSKHARNVAALKNVVADGSRKAAAVAAQAERESRRPVPLSLTPEAERALDPDRSGSRGSS